MSDGPYSADNLQEYSVSDLSFALKRTVEDRFGYVRVRGELSGVKFHSSGHLYLALKDEKTALDGVCWRGTARKLTFKPEDGLEVVCTGKLSTYPARSKYQIVIEYMEPAGAGALMALLEERKKKLAAEGLFAAERKRAIPFLPSVIGVVTSPTGSVIRDILHRLSERFPRHVLLWPVAVQGEKAAEQVAAAVQGFNALDANGPVPRPDVLIVARGGGSIEDLWPFNEEVVVRAVVDSEIPVISAVGHETDTTLIDYAADLRAPTPTAAAEKAVPVRADLLHTVGELAHRRDRARRRYFQALSDRLTSLGRALPRPRDMLGLAQQRLDDLSGRLSKAPLTALRERRAELARLEGGLNPNRLIQLHEYKARGFIDLARRLDRVWAQERQAAHDRVQALGRVLESYSYHATLARGFAVLRDDRNQPITRAGALKAGQAVEAELRDGRRSLTVTSAEAPSGPPRPSGKNHGKRKRTDERQGSLL